MRALQIGGGGLAAVLGVGVGLLVLALVNGGLAYRKDCPTSEGKVRHDWTFQWFAPIPYVFRPSEEGCSVHTGTRVALSALGIWPIGDDSQGEVSSESRSRVAVRMLGEIKTRMDALDVRITGIRPEQPLTQESLAAYTRELRPAISEYGALAEEAVTARARLGAIPDEDVDEAWDLLVRRLRGGHDGLAHFATAIESGRFSRRDQAALEETKNETDRIDARLKQLLGRINDRYFG